MSQVKQLMPMAVCILDKTLVVLGAGPDQTPGILKAKEMGIYTIALDGNPEAVGKSSSDEFYTVSIKHFEQIEMFIKNTLQRKVDGVIAFGVDIPAIIARTSDLLNVNYTIPFESAKKSEDKLLAKEFMEHIGINIPAYQLISSSKETEQFSRIHGFPIVVKPVDNSAARGVSLVKKQEYIDKAYNEALNNSINKKIIVEKYLDGPQISTESFVVNGEVFNIGFADRNYNDMEKFFPNIIENGGDLPSLYMHQHHKEKLTEYFQLISKELNIKNGVIKGDIVIHNNELYIIEFALRLSGGNFSTIEIPECTGIDFLKIAIQLHLNLEINHHDLFHTKNNHISIRYKFSEDSNVGIVKKVNYPDMNSNIILQQFHINPGERIISKTTDHAKRLGYVIASGKSREAAIDHAEQQLKNMEIIVE